MGSVPSIFGSSINPAQYTFRYHQLVSEADTSTTKDGVDATELAAYKTKLHTQQTTLSDAITNLGDLFGGFLGTILKAVKQEVDVKVQVADRTDAAFGVLNDSGKITDAKIDTVDNNDLRKGLLSDYDLGIAVTTPTDTGSYYRFLQEADKKGNTIHLNIFGQDVAIDRPDGHVTSAEVTDQINSLNTKISDIDTKIAAETDSTKITLLNLQKRDLQGQVLAGQNVQTNFTKFKNYDATNHDYITYAPDPSKVDTAHPPTTINEYLAQTSDLFGTANKDTHIEDLSAADLA